jgi:LysM domain
MSAVRRVGVALGAMVILAAFVFGVPVVLVRFVGNPWPGRTRWELRDEAGVLAGVLAALAWLIWARFVVAVVIEAREQLAAMRVEERREPAARVEVVAPPPARGGIGLLAQRLVAAALIILPLAVRAVPAVAGTPVGLPESRAQTALIVDAEPAVRPEPPERAAPTTDGSVVVAAGDTLIGLARTHLGDPGRWREIFELNRGRPQADGGRLATPSLISPGWRLRLPAERAGAAHHSRYLAAETITIEPGDNLWNLSAKRLAAAGLPHDEASVGDHVAAVIADNQQIVEDPDLIHPGERFAFPAVGTPPAPATPEQPAPPAHPGNDRRPAREPTIPPPRRPVGLPPPTSLPVAESVTTAPSTTVVPDRVPPSVPPTAETDTRAPGAPSPIGAGEATLLTAGVLALLAARRRSRLRAARPRARLPVPPPDMVAAERRLHVVDANERLLRIDVAVRAAAASLVGGLDGAARVAVVRAGRDGEVELTLTASAALPTPWIGDSDRWRLPGGVPIELLAEPARTVGAPCVALAQLGVDADGRDVLVDFEALGLLAVAAPPEVADSVVTGLAAAVVSSLFAEVANVIGVGVDPSAFLDHRHAHRVDRVDEALELAAMLLGTTGAARQSTFVLRARHTGGEAWEPALVFTGSSVADEVTADVARTAGRRQGGLAMVVAADPPGAPWRLRADDRRWVLQPLGLELVPVGVTARELDGIHEVLQQATAPLVMDDVATPADDGDGSEQVEPEWTLLVRLLGPVEVVDRAGRVAHLERSKTLELIAWLALHREHSTRAGARTALWELDVRDATFANVVSEARRAMARLVAPPEGEEWLARTLTEVLPLHQAVVTDADLVRARLRRARLQPPELAIETLRPAVELIRDLPFAGTGYLWPDAEGITSNLVLLATGAATELAGHCLSVGDIDGVFSATGHGLRVLPGHEELIALRMRAHAKAGDLSGVRLEWETYERVLNADPWSDGEPAPKLVVLRRELLSS